MKFEISKTALSRNIVESLRQCGYYPNQDPRIEQLNFIRRLSKTVFYPRFHLYVEDLGNDFKFSLHLDQKRPSYQGAKAHSADYDEPAVAEEKQRIINLLN